MCLTDKDEDAWRCFVYKVFFFFISSNPPDFIVLFFTPDQILHTVIVLFEKINADFHWSAITSHWSHLSYVSHCWDTIVCLL